MSKGKQQSNDNSQLLKKQEPSTWQKEESYQELLDSLRDNYLSYKETAGRRKLELRPRKGPGAGAKLMGQLPNEQNEEQEFKEFYLQPQVDNVPQLDEPEKQKKWRSDLLSDICSRPEPEPLTYLADNLHLEQLQKTEDHSKPSKTRNDLADFFRRYSVHLQHKKYKMLGRWADQSTSSLIIDTQANYFDLMIGRIQMEYDSAYNRTERLQIDDSYDLAINPLENRPQPISSDKNEILENGTTLLYSEQPEKSINSLIRLDDVEVYLRIQTYREKLFRHAQKLANGIKWIPYSRRWGVLKKSRLLMCAYKTVYNEKRNIKLKKIKQFAQDRLVHIGVQEDRLLDQICKKFTQHLKLEEYSRYDNKLLSSYKCNHEKPPFLFLSNVEFKDYLVPLAKESKLAIGEFQEIDGGRQASYQVDTLFPAEFQKQALAIQFDWLDSGLGTQADTDILIIQKLTQELQIDKNEMLDQMAKQAETERKKSILGQISKDNQNSEQSGKKSKKAVSNNQDEAEEIARENLVRRVKDMRFFSLDPSFCKLKKADWLNYVCWQPNISEFIKRQNHHLSSPDENPIDALLLSAFEFLDVNEAGAAIKILEDSATAHVRKVKGYYTEISQAISKPQNDKLGTVEKILTNATFGQDGGVKSASQENNNYNQSNIEEYLQSIDPLKFDLVKSYYMLRLLKSRGLKAKLLHSLNYFRAVQKQLAYDVREFFTREKALGGQHIEDALIGPQFGKDERGNLRAKAGGSSGPGGLNATRIQRQLDQGSYQTNLPDGTTLYDLVSMKGYKYNKRFNPQLTSTCPCVPKFHTTFGRPTLYQDISKEMENRLLEPGRWKTKANPIPATKDRLIFKKGNKNLSDSEVFILDEHGIQIMYVETLNDMLLLEEELIKIGSYYLNKAEVSQFVCSSEPPSTMMDRGEVALHLIQHELEFQTIKIQLVELLLDAYNNICDPLESVRLIQIISDVMAIRPRVNLEASYFTDCYDSEKIALQERVNLYAEFLNFQKNFEQNENQNQKKFQELKMRKLLEFIQGKWQYKRNQKKVERIGAKEEQMTHHNIEQDINGRKAKILLDIQRQQDLKEIAERHITEFAGDQHTDFAQVLGLPQVTAADLFKRQGQLDPLIIDVTREHCNFSKQIEGYPWFFVGKNQHIDNFGLQLQNLAPTDFYESVVCITRVHSACEQALEELRHVHNPENGIASSCLDRAVLYEAQQLLGNIKTQFQESKQLLTKSKNQIEQDFYLSSSDKLVFLMREFKANLNPECIQTEVSPILISKLDVTEVAKYDFPRLKLQDTEGFDQLSDDKITERMIDLAKETVIKKKFGQKSHELNQDNDDFVRTSIQLDDNQIQSPSLLILSCNVIELQRLRSQLIQLIYESDVLSKIYIYQLKKSDKPTEKLVGAPSTTFDTRQITKEYANYVDYNDGTKLDIDLPFTEFDPTLKASLDFQSESCVKALMTSLGVEELRAVIKYQLMQKQILSISIMRNQSLMDGPQQGLKELKWLGRRNDPFCLPGSMLNMKELFMGALDGPSSSLCKREQQRMSSNLSKEIGPFIMSISAIKTRHKASVARKWAQIYQKIINNDKQMESQLRMLRSFRLKLLHEYCQDVMKEIYVESLPLQTVLVCRELRRKAQLFPKETNLLKINQGAIIEHLPFELCSKKQDQFSFDQQDHQFKLNDLIQGKPKSLLFVPSTSEIMDHARTAAQENQAAVGSSSSNQIDEDSIDQQLKLLNRGPVFLSPSEMIIQNEGRLVNFKQAFNYPEGQTHVLQLFSYLLQIVSLEYFMGRNNAPGPLILQLEDFAMSGRNFWVGSQQQDTDKDNQQRIHQEASKRVIQKIMNTKRFRIDLAEDMEQISRRLLQINDFLKTNNADQLKLPCILDLMKMQHQASYLQMLNGIENSIDIYLDHKSQDYFEKVQEVQAIISRRDNGFNLLGNGHYFNNGIRESLQIDTSSICLQDNDEFLKGYQSVIDEAALVPTQPTLVRRLFGRSAQKVFTARPGLLSLQIPCYQYLSSSFLNMDDEQREFLATNFFQLDEGLNQYLILLGLASEKVYQNKEINSQQVLIIRPKDVLQAKIDYLGLKVEQKQLQRVLMSWSICCALPNDITSYLKAIDLYREQTMLKSLLKRDELIQKYYETNQKDTGESGSSPKKTKSVKQSILDNINKGSREHQLISKICQIKAEIQVTSRTLDIEMIKMSRNMIEREHEALLATFEQAAAHERVLALVHPQQQFASTLFQSVDRNSHLDVVNKLGFVQVFLTKLRNRCTEVETLASGPGIVFSLKDFNECLQNFCQGALKYSEAELRTRVETQYIRQNQYQHLIYMKEKQAYYYRRKCEQFLENIDKIVNSKISQKGSQLIYELDVASRELRVLKDNYRLMQGLMMSELRHEYLRAIQERQNKILELREAKTLLGDAVKSETLKAVDQCFTILISEVDKVRLTRDRPVISFKQRALEAFQEQKTNKGGMNHNLTESLEQSSQVQLFTEKGKPLLSANDRKDILDLMQYIKKLKALQMMKNVGVQERHERELANLRAQLTSNAALWDQLAEAEKREQITKQELTMTKLSLASYEKLIEKLQGQLENLNNQKSRLQQFKNSKSKRIDELENKMKDLEILENIDLNRILTELKNRDKKIDELKLITQEGKGQLQNAQKQRNQKDITELKNKIAHERDLKLQAYERLEGLRIEMRALEGKDIKSDLWKEKCKELFDMCKDLEQENSELKTLANETNKANLLKDNANFGGTLSVNPIEDARSHGQPSLGNHNPGGLGERMFTHRTLGVMAGVNKKKFQPGRLASGGGIFSGYPQGNYPGNIPSSKGVDPSNNLQETVYTDNFNSLKYSGGGQVAHQIADAQDIIQMGGLGMFAEQSIASGNIGTRDSFPGSAVLAGPLLNFQQYPRHIMTAGGGSRAFNGQIKRVAGKNYPDEQRIQSFDPTSQKSLNRNLYQNQPWNNIPTPMMNKNSQIPKIQQRGRTLNQIKTNEVQSDQLQNKMQGKAMNLGGMVIKQASGLNQKQQSQDQLGLNAINATLAASKGQQPMNVNINFNTTNISLNK